MNTFMGYMRELYQFSRRKFILILVLMIVEGLTGGIGILLLIPLLAVTGIVGQPTLDIPFLSGIVGRLNGLDVPVQLVLILMVYLTLIAAQSAVSRKSSILNAEIVQGFTKHLRVSLYQRLVRAEWACFAGKQKAHITNALTNEISRVGSGTLFFLRILSQIIVAGFQLAVAFMLSVPLSLFVLACGLIVVWLMRHTIRDSKRLGQSLLQINQSLMTQIREQLDGVKESKSYGIEAAQTEAFEQTAEKTRRNITAFTVLQSKTTFLYNVIAAVVICVLFYFSVVVLHIDPALLLVIVYIFARLWPSFKTLHGSLQNVIAMLPAYVSLRELSDDLDEHREDPGDAAARSPFPADAPIRFEGVGFRYDAEGFAIRDLSFEIPARKMTAFIGRSGAGKSTIIDLLIGLLKPTQGRISVGGETIGGGAMQGWRRSIAYVPQDPFLFNGTISDNLLRYTPGATDADVDDALRRAAAYAFVNKLPQGTGTVIGDDGVRLSGGERQRIVLARALLRKPRYLVLDEATSSLDTENETRIQKAVEALSGELTVIVIAHRLSTVKNADKLIVIDEGRVTEQGTYAELLANPDGYLSKSLENIE